MFLLENKIFTIPIAILAIIFAVYSGISYFQINGLETKISDLQRDKAQLESIVDDQQQAVSDVMSQVDSVKEQCRILIEYERARCKKKPEATDEDPDNGFVDKLFGGRMQDSRSFLKDGVHAPRADTDTDPSRHPSNQRPYPIKVRPEGSIPRR